MDVSTYSVIQKFLYLQWIVHTGDRSLKIEMKGVFYNEWEVECESNEELLLVSLGSVGLNIRISKENPDPNQPYLT